MNVSHSELACYQACPRKWHLRYRLRRTALVSAERLNRGKRIHAALASWWTGHTPYLGDFPDIERAMLAGYAARWQEPPFKATVNESFRIEVGSGIYLEGEVDGLTEVLQTVVEHKTTTSDITPGSSYWRRVTHCDRQVSIYLMAFGGTVLYDVLRVPQFRAGDVYQKSLDAMAAEPEKYFQRATITRSGEELELVKEDISELTTSMCNEPGMAARNPQSCHSFGDECEFFSVCWHGQDPSTMPEWNDPSFECQRGR